MRFIPPIHPGIFCALSDAVTASSARPMRVQCGLLRRLTASSAASCALSIATSPSARPQSGLMCFQHTRLRPQCKIISNPCPPPRGVKVINSTIATHRPVDYSSPCGLLIALWITLSPVDYLPTVHSAPTCVQCSVVTVPQHYSVCCSVTLQCLPGHSVL